MIFPAMLDIFHLELKKCGKFNYTVLTYLKHIHIQFSKMNSNWLLFKSYVNVVNSKPILRILLVILIGITVSNNRLRSAM